VISVQASQHALHFHAYYQEHVAVYGIESVEMLAGALPKRQQRLVEAWAELHQVELMADWDRLQTGHKPLPIAPLT
jgi:Domain of unknown function (DUF4160)